MAARRGRFLGAIPVQLDFRRMDCRKFCRSANCWRPMADHCAQIRQHAILPSATVEFLELNDRPRGVLDSPSTRLFDKLKTKSKIAPVLAAHDHELSRFKMKRVPLLAL